ncbi:N/A [soil metagenome]
MLLDADAPFLYDWLNRDYARFWGLQGQSLAQIHANYAAILARGNCEVSIGVVAATGERKFLFESYDIRSDRLSAYVETRPGDRGFHLLLGPPEPPLPAAAYYSLQGMAAWIFRDPDVQRLVAEPDVRNRKILIRLAQAGFRFGRVIHMPHKTALLSYLSRADFERTRGLTPPPAPVEAPLRGLRLRFHLGVSRVGRRLGLIASDW